MTEWRQIAVYLIKQQNKHKYKGVYYFSKHGFSINEGGTPINITILWKKGLFFYIFLFGKRFHLNL